MTDLDSIPDDDDGAVLRSLAEHGNNLSKFMVIDFHVVVPDQEIGLAFSEVATRAGYKTELSYDKEEDEFTAWCSKLMLPEHQALIDAQVELAEMALPFGGAIDGWGTEGNAAN
jgi:regulator of RNase E activity RraB